MALEILTSEYLNEQESQEIARICAECDDFDAFGDNTGFPVLFAVYNGEVAGFLSGCHVPATLMNGPQTLEVTAAVSPRFQHRRIFTRLLQKAVKLSGRMYPDTAVTGCLPNELGSCSLARDYLFDELLMDLWTKEQAANPDLPEAFSIKTLPAEDSEILTLCQDETEVSRLTLSRQDSFACISDVITPEEKRGHGYATMLIQVVINGLPAKTHIMLEVRSSNKPALRVYQKTGFAVVEGISYYRFDRLF